MPLGSKERWTWDVGGRTYFMLQIHATVLREGRCELATSNHPDMALCQGTFICAERGKWSNIAHYTTCSFLMIMTYFPALPPVVCQPQQVGIVSISFTDMSPVFRIRPGT